MRQMLTAAIVVVSMASAACAGMRRPGMPERLKPAAEAEREVRHLEEVEWAAAVQRKDTAWFQRHLADELVLTTGRTGRVTNKPQEMADILAPTTGGGDDRLDDLRVQPYGNMAVATFRLTSSGSDAAGPYQRTARYTEVWLFREGRWQLVASHSSLLPRP